MAKKTGTFIVSSKGFFATKFVLKPSFSACAKASSVVPVLEQLSLNSLKLGSSLKSSAKGWSTDSAKNEHPNKVSGLVVNIFTSLNFLQFSSLKFISHPKDFPIQFFLHGFNFVGPAI